MEFTVTVGVVGHRVLAEIERLIPAIRAAGAAVRAAYPGHSIRILSALAEGADRLVPETLLDSPGVTLDVVLPLPVDLYSTDFQTSASRTEFASLLSRANHVETLPPRSSRPASYTGAANYILDHSQVLIGVWDGQQEQGRGGTGETVAEARRRGMKLAWIHAGNRRSDSLQPVSLGGEQGLLTLEGF